jgi:hypothetical protein
MNKVSIEQLLILLIFVLVPLLQFIVERLRRGVVIQPTPDEAVLPTPQPQRMSQTPSVGEAQTSKNVPVAQTQRTASPPHPLQFTRRRLLASREEIRRAIVYKTILEACRADDPPA